MVRSSGPWPAENEPDRLKPRSHFPGSRPRMSPGCDPGVIRGSTGLIRGDLGWSMAGPKRPRCIKMFNTTGSHPGLTPGWVIRGSSGSQPGSPGLNRGMSVTDEPRSSPGWTPNNSRMSPGWAPEESWMTYGLATDDPSLATVEPRITHGRVKDEARINPGNNPWLVQRHP